MKRALIKLLIVILVMGLSPASAQEQATAEVDGEFFRLILQPGWRRQALRNDFNSAYLRISSPDGIDEGAVYLQVFPKGRFTEDSYRGAVRRYVAERMEGRILSETEVTVNNREAWRVEYEGNSVGYVGARRHFMNTVFFVGNRILVVHCAAQSDRWEDWKEAFLATSDSFQTVDN